MDAMIPGTDCALCYDGPLQTGGAVIGTLEETLYLQAHKSSFTTNFRAVEDVLLALATSDEVTPVLILDLSSILRLDSRAVRCLVELQKSLEEKRQQLVLANVPLHIKRAFEYLKLATFFKTMELN